MGHGVAETRHSGSTPILRRVGGRPNGGVALVVQAAIAQRRAAQQAPDVGVPPVHDGVDAHERRPPGAAGAEGFLPLCVGVPPAIKWRTPCLHRFAALAPVMSPCTLAVDRQNQLDKHAKDETMPDAALLDCCCSGDSAKARCWWNNSRASGAAAGHLRVPKMIALMGFRASSVDTPVLKSACMTSICRWYCWSQCSAKSWIS